jgi:DNA helicase-2/ATP-dependent DNA helicase PcrA
MNVSHTFHELNESQKRAVVTTEGPVLIVAGPGTGKTLTIVRRISYLINYGVRPENILAVTFTNRAAREMMERTEALLGYDAGKVFIGTLHFLGLRIIKDVCKNSFIIYNREEQMNLLKKLIKDPCVRKISQGKRHSSQLIAEKISRIKNLLADIDDGIERIYNEYQAALIKNAALDFDDLILKPVEILSNDIVLERYREFFKYIMVDEYQDINPAQYKLLTLLARGNRNLCAIGDSDQAIYAFRGADVGNLLSFERDFKDAKIIALTENYRSTGVILNASNNLIKNNLERIDKELRPTRGKGIPITVISVPDEKAEGEMIVKEIEEKIGGTSHYQLYTKKTQTPLRTRTEETISSHCSYSFSDFAVIYRTNAQAKAIEGAFIPSGIPYKVIGEKYLVKRIETLKFLSFLKTIINPVNDPHLCEGFDLSEKAIERLKNLKDNLPLDEFIGAVWEESGIKEHCSEENFVYFKDFAIQYRHMKPEEAMDNFINEVSLLTSADFFDPKAEAVTLMTLHMAKGLEFKVVFIVGLEDGLIPYTSQKEDVDIEEERRLFYVGMTRAMDDLFLIYARNRFLYGQRLAQSPSPFLREIPEELLKRSVIPDRIKKSKKERQIYLF